MVMLIGMVVGLFAGGVTIKILFRARLSEAMASDRIIEPPTSVFPDMWPVLLAMSVPQLIAVGLILRMQPRSAK